MELRHATGAEPELIGQRGLLDGVCAVEFPYPKERFAGRGVVMCGGGEKYLPSVYVLVRLLRHLRCRLPIECGIWASGKCPAKCAAFWKKLGAVCMDGLAMRRVHPARRLDGWELKCYALLHCAFAEVLLLDADNGAVRHPEFLLRTPQYVPATVPARSDTVLVMSMVFNDAGEQSESTDPMGTVTRQEFDQAGRVVKTIENYQP